MEKISIKTDRRYVAATMAEVPLFLGRNFMNGSYIFMSSISAATKCVGKEAAEDMIKVYRRETGDNQAITILPIEVSYRIIDG